MDDRQSVADWRTSSYTGNGGGTCVEVGQAADTVAIRDTTQSHLGLARTVLSVPPEAWRRFTQRLR